MSEVVTAEDFAQLAESYRVLREGFKKVSDEVRQLQYDLDVERETYKLLQADYEHVKAQLAELALEGDWKNLGERLRDARGSHSLADVAEGSGVSENTIIAWEKGRQGRVSTRLYALTEFYGWPPGALIRVLEGSRSMRDE